MKDNKIAILVVIVIILLGITVSVLLTQPTENNNQNENSNNIENNENKNPVKPIYKYLVINNSDIWNYANNNWFTEKENRVEDKKFKIYVNNEFFGNYYLKYTTKWNIFNENKKFINYNGNILAYTEEFNVKVKNFTKENVADVDLNRINLILKGSFSFEDLSNQEKIIVDLDNNGVTDKIISVSNIDSENQNKYFNLVYVDINGAIKVLLNDVVEIKNLLIEPIYNIEYIVNIENNKYDNIIIKKGYFSDAGTTNSLMYQYVDNEYKMIKD